MDFLKSATRRILRQPQRSILTMVGIAIGIVAVVLVSLIGDLGTRAINNELAGMGIDGLVVSTSADVSESFSAEDLEETAALEEVESVTPLLTVYSRSRMKNMDADCLLWGMNEDSADVVSIELVHGRMLTAEDISTAAPVCLLEESYAELQYGRSNIVGKTVQFFLGGSFHKLEVVGIIRSGGMLLQSVMGQVVPCFSFLPYTTLQQFGGGVGFQQMVLRPGQNADTEVLTQTITSNYPVGDITVEDLNAQRSQLNNMLGIVSKVLTLIGGISLLVAGVSIMTTMLVSVQERTREIGIKKAIGATDGMILREVLVESLLLTLTGALGGTILAVSLCVVGCWIIGYEMIYNFALWGGCILFAMLLGAVCGVYPALRAARLQPVDALRSN